MLRSVSAGEGVQGRNGRRNRPQRSWSRAGWLFVLVIASLFALNYWTADRVTREPALVRVPYSPLFLDQVRAGNVMEIRSQGTAIQGTFDHDVKYPATAGRPTVRRFVTEIPAFADTKALSDLLQRHNVVVNAEPLDTGLPWWENLLFGFGPTLLFLVLLLLLARRAGRGGAGLLGSFGHSRALKYEPRAQRVTFKDVAGIDETKAELAEIVDFLKEPQ